MADDERRLRDELEKVQSEVKRLRAALEKPDALHQDTRARIEQLRRSREQQLMRLEETGRQEDELLAELGVVQAGNHQLEEALEAAQRSERVLVDNTVHALDPGPARAGCLSVLLLFGAIFW